MQTTATTFLVNDRVLVASSHWNKHLHGQSGSVHSVTTAADGSPTCWVRFASTDGRLSGEFILCADLIRCEVPHYAARERLRKATLTIGRSRR